jgi:glucokinase
MLLAGDIGGTKTVLAQVVRRADGIAIVREEIFASAAHASLDEIIDRFRGGSVHGVGDVEVACFGVAGPVVDGECRTTNLPWVLRETELARAIGARRVKLLNDLEAAAYGMLHLPASQVVEIQGAARTTPGTVAVLAAGTGLGEALLYWDGSRYHPIPTEGGHTTFAPQTDEDWAFAEFLRRRFGAHVSWERVVAGPGFVSLYEFFREQSVAEEPAWLRERLARENPSAVVTDVGLRGDDPVCVQAVEAFARHFGAEAGNLALKSLALGGVYLGGNIANVIFPALADHFLGAFVDKGRFASLLKTLPVRIARDPRVPLIGAAHYAAAM